MMRNIALLLSLILVVEGHRAKGKHTAFAHLQGYSEYVEYRKIHRSQQDEDLVDFQTRLNLFNKRKAEADAHNKRHGVHWTEGVNHLSDWTPEEYKTLLGYKRNSRWHDDRHPAQDTTNVGASASPSRSSSFLQVQPGDKPAVKPSDKPSADAESVDWTVGFVTATHVKNQKTCGSCWAAATVGALEWYAEMKLGKGNTLALSIDQLVDCAENVDKCGGDGGCRGSTGELALDWVNRFILRGATYYAGTGSSNGEGERQKLCDTSGGYKDGLKISNFVRLKPNDYDDLKRAVLNYGPIIVSVDAGPWSGYSGGVFHGCAPDTVVNHAVILAGFGAQRVKLPKLSGARNQKLVQQQLKYWYIRNSWGPSWGENGYIRLLRTEGSFTDWNQKNDATNQNRFFCGNDTDYQQGVGCANDPKWTWVCGMCGVLSDSCYPDPTGISVFGSPEEWHVNSELYHLVSGQKQLPKGGVQVVASQQSTDVTVSQSHQETTATATFVASA